MEIKRAYRADFSGMLLILPQYAKVRDGSQVYDFKFLTFSFSAANSKAQRPSDESNKKYYFQ